MQCQWRVDSWLSSEVILSYRFAPKIGKNLKRKTKKCINLGEMDGQLLNTMKTLDVETGDWKMQAQTLKMPRKDHACANVR